MSAPVAIFKDELWKDYPPDPRYIISSHGRVYSRIKQRLLRFLPKANGYNYFGISLGNGKTKLVKVSRAVMLTFIGPCPEGMEVAHLDSSSTNDNLMNLAYVTHLENVLHRNFNGTSMGENNPSSKFTEKQVLEIRKEYQHGKPGKGYTSLAKKYGVRSTSIKNIIIGKTWKNVIQYDEKITNLVEAAKEAAPFIKNAFFKNWVEQALAAMDQK